MAKKTFIVTHPKLYMKVKGRLTHVETGTEVSLDEKHVESLLKQGKVLVKGQGKKVDIGDDVKLNAAQKKKLKGEIKTLEKDLVKAKSEVKALEDGDDKVQAEAKAEELTKSLAEANEKLNA